MFKFTLQLIFLFMELPNIHFQDFPIEFKKINTEDFPNFTTQEKVIISPNAEGYINEQIQANIILEEKNTIVINAAVGNGKSYAIIQTIKRFYDAGEDYLIFVASPFVSLVEQYYQEILEKTDIPNEQIYKYNFLGENPQIDYIGRKIQIVTANTLLGNPGEDAFINSNVKREYINRLIENCNQNDIKVVFIYDEIHDAFHNFKEKYVFNLWKWKNLIRKNIILSATYCEASKVVIEYLAELTDCKIQIIESERVRFPEKQSELFLHYDHSKSYSNSTDNLINIVAGIFDRGLDVDILCFSKKLAEEIYNSKTSGVGELLYNKYGENINKAVSELVDNQRTERGVPKSRYKKDKANIGTNFKTGVSIEKENHAYVVILPPYGAKTQFKNFYGIFSSGINSLIQAMARKRVKGEIHIILPRPGKFDYSTLPFTEEIKKDEFIKWYETVHNYRSKSSEIVKYIPLAEQDNVLSDFYNNVLKANVAETFESIENRNSGEFIRLDFPEYKLFKLDEGEDYLSQVYNFFGKDLSAYITYCAFTNQFVNCNLSHINLKPAEFFNVGSLQWRFEVFYENYFIDEWIYSLRQNVSDSYIYHEIRNEIFSNHTVFYKSSSDMVPNIIMKDENKHFETQLIAFIQRKLYRNNGNFLKRYEIRGYFNDSNYTRGDYFVSCIAHSNRLMSEIESLSENTQSLVKAYQSLDYFRNKMIDSIQTIVVNRRQLRYLKKFNESEPFITSNDVERFNEMVSMLIERDYFIKNEIFDFRNNFERSENRDDTSKQISGIYNYLKSDFFVTKQKRVNNSLLNDNIFEVEEIIQIPNPNLVMDFLSPSEMLFEEKIPVYTVENGKLIVQN